MTGYPSHPQVKISTYRKLFSISEKIANKLYKFQYFQPDHVFEKVLVSWLAFIIFHTYRIYKIVEQIIYLILT